MNIELVCIHYPNILNNKTRKYKFVTARRRNYNSLAVFRAVKTKMDAETKHLIHVEIQNTITDSQNTLMTEIKSMISSEMSSMQI